MRSGRSPRWVRLNEWGIDNAAMHASVIMLLSKLRILKTKQKIYLGSEAVDDLIVMHPVPLLDAHDHTYRIYSDRE